MFFFLLGRSSSRLLYQFSKKPLCEFKIGCLLFYLFSLFFHINIRLYTRILNSIFSQSTYTPDVYILRCLCPFSAYSIWFKSFSFSFCLLSSIFQTVGCRLFSRWNSTKFVLSWLHHLCPFAFHPFFFIALLLVGGKFIELKWNFNWIRLTLDCAYLFNRFDICHVLRLMEKHIIVKCLDVLLIYRENWKGVNDVKLLEKLKKNRLKQDWRTVEILHFFLNKNWWNERETFRCSWQNVPNESWLISTHLYENVCTKDSVDSVQYLVTVGTNKWRRVKWYLIV